MFHTFPKLHTHITNLTRDQELNSKLNKQNIKVDRHSPHQNLGTNQVLKMTETFAYII